MRTNLELFLIILLLFFSKLLYSQQDKIAETNNLLTLENEAFFEALDKFSTQYYYHLSFGNHKSIVNKSYSLSDTLTAYWALLEKIINSKPENHHDSFGATRSLEHILYEMIKIAGDSEYSKLLNYYDTIPDNNYFKYGSFLFPLCNARIKNEIDNIIGNKIKSESKFFLSKQNVVALPPESVTVDLQENWYLFKSLEAHYKTK